MCDTTPPPTVFMKASRCSLVANANGAWMPSTVITIAITVDGVPTRATKDTYTDGAAAVRDGRRVGAANAGTGHRRAVAGQQHGLSTELQHLVVDPNVRWGFASDVGNRYRIEALAKGLDVPYRSGKIQIFTRSQHRGDFSARLGLRT